MRTDSYRWSGRAVLGSLVSETLPPAHFMAERQPSAPARASAVIQPVITRKKRGGGPPTDKDMIAWLHAPSSKILALRSPLDFNSWVTSDEHAAIVEKLIHENAVFASRKGFATVSASPNEGTPGWIPLPGHRRFRRKVRYVNGQWVPATRSGFDEY